MCHTSANVHYWSTVVDALSCINDYVDAINDDEKCEEYHRDLLDSIEAARSAYSYCEISHSIPFGMEHDYDIDGFIDLMLEHPRYYNLCRQRALDSYAEDATAVPLRSL